MTKKEQTRNDILSISKASFIKKGYKDTLMIDIARAASIDRRTIYRHFDTKEILLLTIANRMYIDFGNYLQQISFPISLTGLKKLEMLFKEYTSYFHDNIDMLIITKMLDNNLSNETRTLSAYKDFVKATQVPDLILSDLIKNGVNDNSLKPTIDSYITSITINNSLLTLASRVVGHKDILDKEQGLESWNMVYLLGKILLQGIKND